MNCVNFGRPVERLALTMLSCVLNEFINWDGFEGYLS